MYSCTPYPESRKEKDAPGRRKSDIPPFFAQEESLYKNARLVRRAFLFSQKASSCAPGSRDSGCDCLSCVGEGKKSGKRFSLRLAGKGGCACGANGVGMVKGGSYALEAEWSQASICSGGGVELREKKIPGENKLSGDFRLFCRPKASLV